MTGPRITNARLVQAGVIAGWWLATNGKWGPAPAREVNTAVRRVLAELGAGAVT